MALSRQLAQAARRLADQTSERLAEPPRTRPFFATVITVTPGAASDGNALVAVTWRGDVHTCAGYDSGYTPAVGHRVRCELIDDQLVVSGRYIGAP